MTFITLEGGEGSGKTSQAKILQQYLSDYNIKSIITKEPGGTVLADQLRSLLFWRCLRQRHPGICSVNLNAQSNGVKDYVGTGYNIVPISPNDLCRLINTANNIWIGIMAGTRSLNQALCRHQLIGLILGDGRMPLANKRSCRVAHMTCD